MLRSARGRKNSQITAAMMNKLLTKIVNSNGSSTTIVATTRPTGPNVMAEDRQRE
jgi:hypothetical protein